MSRDALLAEVTGAARRALSCALRDAGEGPRSPERNRRAAAALVDVTPTSLGDAVVTPPSPTAGGRDDEVQLELSFDAQPAIP